MRYLGRSRRWRGDAFRECRKRPPLDESSQHRRIEPAQILDGQRERFRTRVDAAEDDPVAHHQVAKRDVPLAGIGSEQRAYTKRLETPNCGEGCLSRACGLHYDISPNIVRPYISRADLLGNLARGWSADSSE